jgi:hypothetical protein
MKTAFEPSASSTRMVTITLKSEDRITSQWIAREARKTLPDGKKSLVVLSEPEEVKGVARLINEKDTKTNGMFLYLPAIDRIRRISPVMAYDIFLNTDFTFAGLGFIDIGGTSKLVGTEKKDEVMAFKVETIPDKQYYYSRIVTWVSCNNHLPIERHYYDVAGRLWKKQHFENVTVINGVATPLLIRMVDHQNLTSTDYSVSELCYGENVPDDVFSISRTSQLLLSIRFVRLLKKNKSLKPWRDKYFG